MRALFEQIEQVAPTRLPVLIRGETGTGKELVAAAIQRLSARRDRRFEIVNCGGLSRELVVSELFGHERGAFTGAAIRKKGLLAMADGGTLFLDEVGELSPEAQVLLLRFLQQREIRPLGSAEIHRVDVRLIAATHRDLKAAVEREAFREDLYHRINRLVIEVPPLRERRDDLRLLVEHVRRTINAENGLSVRGVTPQALARIEAYPWPGNVRELEAVMERAMVFHRGGWVGPEHLRLPDEGRPHVADEARRAPGPLPGGPEMESLTWAQREAVRIAAVRGEVRRGDLMATCGLSTESARRALVALVARGVLRRLGGGRGVRYVLARTALA